MLERWWKQWWRRRGRQAEPVQDPDAFDVKGTVVRTRGKEVRLPFPAWQWAEVRGVLVVVLDVPLNRRYPRNVFGIDHDGRVLWQIHAVQTTVLDGGVFVGVSLNGSLARVHHFDGWAYDLDPADGRLVASEFLK